MIGGDKVNIGEIISKLTRCGRSSRKVHFFILQVMIPRLLSAPVLSRNIEYQMKHRQ